LLDDVQPLADALTVGPVTLTHGDLATVNMAFEGDQLVLLDWAMPTAAPGALDIARFLVGCAHVVDVDLDAIIVMYRESAGPAYDDDSMKLALLSALCWLGWNKALDIVESGDEAVRHRERESLAWWVAKARTALDDVAFG
jgi:thiamine kinase-like enzyme